MPSQYYRSAVYRVPHAGAHRHVIAIQFWLLTRERSLRRLYVRDCSRVRYSGSPHRQPPTASSTTLSLQLAPPQPVLVLLQLVLTSDGARFVYGSPARPGVQAAAGATAYAAVVEEAHSWCPRCVPGRTS